jgi:hypothetical protein
VALRTGGSALVASAYRRIHLGQQKRVDYAGQFDTGTTQEPSLPCIEVLNLLFVDMVHLDREVVSLVNNHLDWLAVDRIVLDRLVLDVLMNLYLRLAPEDNLVTALV